MIIRYLLFLIFVDGMAKLFSLVFFPLAYLLRNYKHNPLNFMLNNSIYGDEYFLDKHKNWSNFHKAYIWGAWRNSNQNLYNSLAKSIKQGEKTIVYNNTTCTNRKVSDLLWRTIKTCNKEGVYKDKFGGYIDYNNSIIGRQRLIFTMEGVKYFRYSGTVRLIKMFKRTFWLCYKFGFEEVNYATQFNIMILKEL